MIINYILKMEIQLNFIYAGYVCTFSKKKKEKKMKLNKRGLVFTLPPTLAKKINQV